MNEQLSALIDDEIAIDDAMHIVASLQSQKQASDAWQQYHMIGDVMRGNALLSADFKSNLMKKLDAEPTVLAPNANKANSNTNFEAQAKSLAQAKAALPAKWSMAASFAAVLVVGYMAMQSFTTADNAAPFEVATVNHLDLNNVANPVNLANQISLAIPVNLASVSTVDANIAPEVTSQESNEQGIPAEYLMAHQASAPSASAYYMQPVSFSE